MQPPVLSVLRLSMCSDVCLMVAMSEFQAQSSNKNNNKPNQLIKMLLCFVCILLSVYDACSAINKMLKHKLDHLYSFGFRYFE